MMTYIQNMQNTNKSVLKHETFQFCESTLKILTTFNKVLETFNLQITESYLKLDESTTGNHSNNDSMEQIFMIMWILLSIFR